MRHQKHIFQESLSPTYVIRGSFICCKYSDLKAIGEFEPRKEAWVPIHINENGKPYYRGKEKEADSKWENYLPEDTKVLNAVCLKWESIEESTRRLNEIRANLDEEMAFAHWVDKRIEYIKTEFNKHLCSGTDVLQEAVQKYNEFDKDVLSEDVLSEDVLQVAKMSKGDRILFYEFVRDHRQTERLEKQRIEHKILPPVETDPSSFKKESKQHSCHCRHAEMHDSQQCHWCLQCYYER